MNCKYLDHQICVRTTGEYRLCCASMEPSNKENVRTHTINEWLSSEVPSNARDLLSQDIWPDACSKCMNEESVGIRSMRIRPRTYGPGISHLDLRFNNNCNLRCTMCNPMSSSSIMIEHKELLDLGIESPWTNLGGEYSWYDDDKGNLFSSLPDLKEIYLTGGEPMMVKNLDKFLEKLDSSVTLRFNTNGTLINPKILKELKRFKEVSMCFSIDGIGKVNEYIRWGSNWADIESNINQYADVCEITVGPTIQIMNVLYYDELREWCDKKQYKVYDNILSSPRWLNINYSPKILKDQIKNFHTRDEEDIKSHEIFRKYISILDKKRSSNIRDFIPEVADIYDIA